MSNDLFDPEFRANTIEHMNAQKLPHLNQHYGYHPQELAELTIPLNPGHSTTVKLTRGQASHVIGELADWLAEPYAQGESA